MTSSVSVIIPAYEAAETVARAIGSALNQTHAPSEIIVVDDGSKDETSEVVHAFGDRVRLLRKTNGGPASARNAGAKVASSDWLAMLDADDWWAPTKLAKQLTLDVAPNVGLISAPTSISYPNVPAEISFDALWAKNWIGNSSTLIRRSVFESLGGFIEDPELISVEDYNLWLRITGSGWRALNYPEVLSHYTRGIGLSSQFDRFLRATLYNIDLCGKLLGLPASRLRDKRREVYQQFGWTALYDRQLATARSLLRAAVAIRPTRSSVLGLLAANLPPKALEVRRRLLGNDRKFKVKNVAASPEVDIFGAGAVPDIDLGNGAPYLLVVVDTEEEFDWDVGPSSSLNVKSIRSQELAQRIFDRFRVVPTYAVDYAVASQVEGYAPLREYVTAGRCEIGAQLHPWVNPPLEETQNEPNMFPGSLPERLEYEKLQVLTAVIEENFRCRPILYRAGRYGAGPNTARSLHKLGYQIDCSVLPFHDLRFKHGPDYRRSPSALFWFGPHNGLLEMPSTVGMTGLLSRFGRELYPVLTKPWVSRLHGPGLCAHLHVLDRVRLTPEGSTLDEAKRLTRSMLRRGDRVFVISYHSPSLEPGNTPYVRTERDLAQFLRWIEGYLDFFLGEIGGIPATPSFIFEEAAAACNPSVLTERYRSTTVPAPV